MITGAGDMVIWKGREIHAHIPGLIFDAEKHLYKFQGRSLKSVTNYTSKLQDYSFANKVDMDFGSAVHEYLYLHDTDKLALGGDPRMESYITGWTQFRDGEGWRTDKMLAEYVNYSEKYQIVGRLDRAFETEKYDDVVDIKTGQPNKITGIQLAPYAMMLIERKMTIASRVRLWEVCIEKTGKVRSRQFDFKKNWQLFLMQYSLQNYLAN